MLIHRAPLPLANGQHQDDYPLILDAIHQPIASTNTTQFDLVAVLHTVKCIAWHSRTSLPLLKLFQKLKTDSTVELSEFLQRLRFLLNGFFNGHLLHQPQPRQ